MKSQERELIQYEAEVEKGRQLAAEVDDLFNQLGLGIKKQQEGGEDFENQQIDSSSKEDKEANIYKV